MYFYYTPHFKRSYRSLSKKTRKKFQKQLQYLTQNLEHPSLRTKKYERQKGVWQARVDRNYRFYFLIKRKICFLLEIKSHP